MPTRSSIADPFFHTQRARPTCTTSYEVITSTDITTFLIPAVETITYRIFHVHDNDCPTIQPLQPQFAYSSSTTQVYSACVCRVDHTCADTGQTATYSYPSGPDVPLCLEVYIEAVPASPRLPHPLRDRPSPRHITSPPLACCVKAVMPHQRPNYQRDGDTSSVPPRLTNGPHLLARVTCTALVHPSTAQQMYLHSATRVPPPLA